MLRQALMGVVVLLAGVAAPAFGQEVKLEWKFKEGDKFYVEDVTNMKEVINLAGAAEEKSETKITMVVSYTIKKVTSEAIHIDMKMEHISVKSDGKAGQFAKFLKKFQGTEYKIVLTPEGSIKKFDGFKEAAKLIVGEDKDQNEILKMFVNEESFVKLVEEGFAWLPAKAVKKDDTWTRETKLPMSPFGEFKVNNSYTYKGKEDGKEVIGLKQNMKYVPPKVGTKIMDLFTVARSDMKAENAKGTYTFDAEKGRLTGFTMNQTFAGALTLNFNGMELTVDLSLESNGVSRVLDKNPIDN
jgi:hypothetical protein